MKRNIAVCILLSIVTCGIYSIYWMIKMNDELHTMAGDKEFTSGGMVFLFTILTCGIYTLYWYFQMGKAVDAINGNENGNTSVLYLILGVASYFVGITGFVNYCLMQDTINKNAIDIE